MRILYLALAILPFAAVACDGAGARDSLIGPGGGPVAAIVVTPSSATVAVGGAAQLTAVALDASWNPVADAPIAWGTTDGEVADVSVTGRVTGIARGNARITATSGTIEGSASVDVVDDAGAPVATVSVALGASALVVGQGTQATATLRDQNGAVLGGRTVSWASSNTNVATIAQDGHVSAIAAGSATITATSEGKSGSATLTVSNPAPTPVASVSVTPATGLVEAGKTLQLTATLRDASGNTLTGRTVSWASSDVAAATVSASGLVTGVNVGTVTISASSEGRTGSATVQVSTPAPPGVVSVLITPETATIDALNQNLQLTATARDASGNTVPGVTFLWRSANTAVATVGASGTVTSKGVGTVLIIAAVGLIADTASVTVRQVPATMSVSPTSFTVAVGTTRQLLATVRDAGGSTIPNPSVSWNSSATSIATVSSSGTVTGVAVGSASITATSAGLSASASATVEAAPPPPPPPPPSAEGIWISRDELRTRPTSGAAWTALYNDAASSPGTADVSNQDSNHDIITLAAALVCVRTNEFCDKARQGVVAAIGTEQGGRWLAVGRNMTAYVIAADLIGLRADADPNSDGSRVHAWIASFLTMRLAHNNTGEPWPLSPFESGSNASAQEGAVYAAIGAYLKNRTALDRVWAAFRTYTCDPGAPDAENIDLGAGIAAGWSHDDAHPCAINPAGTVKTIPAGRAGAGTSRRLDGSIINDMRRGGDYQWPPGYTSYPWVGLEGAVAAAVLLHRAGYPAFEIADRAMLRTHEYLWYLREGTGNVDWFDGRRSDEVVFIINQVYGKSFPTSSGVGGGRTFGYTDWSHMTWR